MMVGMKKPLNIANDTEAICLKTDVGNGALCAGVKYDGSKLVSYAEWIDVGAFTVAASSNKEPASTAVTDQASEWFLQGDDGSVTIIADGSDASYWSAFKIQPLENKDGYTNDWRFNRGLENVTGYVYQR